MSRSPADLELHIAAIGQRLEEAYKLFQETRYPRARQQAIAWLQLQTQAIEARNQAARDRGEQVLDEGADYFAAQGSHIRRMEIARVLAG